MVDNKSSAKPNKDTIYIDADDEITAIIDKVEGSKNKLTALVLPKKFSTLQSIVNMRLLKRSADEADKNIVLVTNDPKILPLAGAAEVHVAKNLQSKPYIPPSPVPIRGQDVVGAKLDEEISEKEATLDYHRSMGEIAVPEEVEEPETISLAEDKAAGVKTGAKEAAKPTAPAKDKKLKIPNFDKFRLRLVLAIAGAIGLIIFLFLATKVLPKASIVVKTTATPISANFELTTSDSAKSIELEKAIIPATLKTSDQTSTQQVQATGQQNKGEKSSGAVTLKNCGSSVVTIPAGTAVSTSGLVYITQSSKSLGALPAPCPSTGANTADVNVVAQSPGAKYNVAAGQAFAVSGYSSVSASNAAAFSGGTDNIVTIVQQSDVDGAKSKITTQSSDEFSKNFQKQLDSQSFYLITSTLKIAEPVVTASPEVGQPASTVNVSIKITYSIVALKKDDLKQIVSDKLKKQIDTSKQQILDSDILKNVTNTVSSQTSPTNMVLSVTAEASATPNIDTDSIKRQAGGQKKGDIRNFIVQLPGVKDVDVNMSPFWVSKAPKSPAKITVTLQQVKD